MADQSLGCRHRSSRLRSRLRSLHRYPHAHVQHPRRLARPGLALAATAHADEAMWMPSQLSELAKPLREGGFRGDLRDLAAVTQPPLSAVVKAGGGTGAFVSGDGLLLTNHYVA
jgi:hypothetical protein